MISESTLFNIVSKYINKWYWSFLSSKKINGANPTFDKNILEDIKSSESHLVLTIIQKNNSKLEIYSLVTKDCSNVITAKEIINMINTDIGSTGGGRDDLAQAGLEYNGKVSDMVTIIENNILQWIQSKES